MSKNIKAFAVLEKGKPLQPFEYDPGELKAQQVEIAVEYCGICHSDLSMIGNEWGMTAYPLVAGHEVIGTITEAGPQVKGLKVGQRVGLGWASGSCLSCHPCMSGDHNLCVKGESTIVRRHGGFADRVRCNWEWAIPLPEKVAAEKAGPLFCGGITVFNPILQYRVKPVDRVGVIGIGGLGHMALQFLNKWGCEVTAFSSSEGKTEEAKRLGAHNVVNSRDSSAMRKIAGSLDFVISTVNVPLDWKGIIATLGPKGRLVLVGVVTQPIPLDVFPLIEKQRSVGGSPLGSPATTADMLEFCGRHAIAPVTEQFPMSKINDAIEHLKSGKARYRVVLKNDFAA